MTQTTTTARTVHEPRDGGPQRRRGRRAGGAAKPGTARASVAALGTAAARPGRCVVSAVGSSAIAVAFAMTAPAAPARATHRVCGGAAKGNAPARGAGSGSRRRTRAKERGRGDAPEAPARTRGAVRARYFLRPLRPRAAVVFLARALRLRPAPPWARAVFAPLAAGFARRLLGRRPSRPAFFAGFLPAAPCAARPSASRGRPAAGLAPRLLEQLAGLLDEVAGLDELGGAAVEARPMAASQTCSTRSTGTKVMSLRSSSGTSSRSASLRSAG